MSELITTIQQLDASAGHTKPAGLALGISPDAIVHPQSVTPEHLMKALPDGTYLVALTDPQARGAIASLTPGSIIDLYDSPSLAANRPAVIVRQGPTHTEFRTAYPLNSPQWRTYEIGGVTYSEADDARNALSTLMSLTRGSEGTQMLGEVFSTTTTGNESEELAEVGHSSHDVPDVVLPHNIVLGNASIRKTVMNHIPNPGERQFARVRLGSEGVEPLMRVDDESVKPESVLEVAFRSRAIALSEMNPTGYGGGTAPDAVLERMIDTMVLLPEVVGNEGTVGEARHEFQQSLKSAPKTF